MKFVVLPTFLCVLCLPLRRKACSAKRESALFLARREIDYVDFLLKKTLCDITLRPFPLREDRRDFAVIIFFVRITFVLVVNKRAASLAKSPYKLTQNTIEPNL